MSAMCSSRCLEEGLVRGPGKAWGRLEECLKKARERLEDAQDTSRLRKEGKLREGSRERADGSSRMNAKCRSRVSRGRLEGD